MKLSQILLDIILENKDTVYNIPPQFIIDFNYKYSVKGRGMSNLDDDLSLEEILKKKAEQFIKDIYQKIDIKIPDLKSKIISAKEIKITGDKLDSTIYLDGAKIKDFDLNIEGVTITKEKGHSRKAKNVKKIDFQKQKDKEKEKLSKHSQKTLIDFDRENISKYIRDTSPELRKKQWNIQIFNKHGYTTAGTGDEAFVKNFLTKVIAFLDLKSMEDDDFNGKGTEQQPLIKGKLKMTTVIYQEKLGAPRKLDPAKTSIYFENTQLNPFFESK